MKYDTVSLITDYGTVDESVGVVKSVIRTIAPTVVTIDITHDIPPFDVRMGSVVLARAANHLAPGVVFAVVDPGVGTSRKAIAVEVGDGESVLVGPDNGLLAPVVAMVGGASRVVELVNEKYSLVAPGHTFAGRDIFAPAVAHICNGVDLAEFGPLVDQASLVPATLPFSESKDGVLHCEVIYVDRYGNLHLNATPEQLTIADGRLSIVVNKHIVTGALVKTFGDVHENEVALVVDEVGALCLVLNKASAAERFGADIGAAVTVAVAN